MTTKILKLIYKKLRNTEWEKLPFGLRGGKIGCMLFVALYSECMKNARARNLSTRMLQDIISDKTVQHYTLISGKLGAAWALYVLNRKGILEKDEALNGILTSFRMKYAIYYSTAPYQILEDDNLFSSGIYTLAQHPDNDTLERYQVEERLISLVDECERQLSQEFITHFLQSNWTPSMLHSYIFFLQTCIKKRFLLTKQTSCLRKSKISIKSKKRYLCATNLSALSFCKLKQCIFREIRVLRSCSRSWANVVFTRFSMKSHNYFTLFWRKHASNIRFF